MNKFLIILFLAPLTLIANVNIKSNLVSYIDSSQSNNRLIKDFNFLKNHTAIKLKYGQQGKIKDNSFTENFGLGSTNTYLFELPEFINDSVILSF